MMKRQLEDDVFYETKKLEPGKSAELEEILSEFGGSCIIGNNKHNDVHADLTKAKAAIESLIEERVAEELRSELVAILDFRDNVVGDSLPWEIGVGRYIEDRLISIQSRLEPQLPTTPKENDR